MLSFSLTIALSLAVQNSQAKTARLIHQFEKAPYWDNRRQYALLVKKGDPGLVEAYFLRKVKQAKRGFYPRQELDFVANSKSRKCTEFMIGCLKNSKANRDYREAAYWHLAKTGGKAGINLVLKMRRKIAPLSRLLERMQPSAHPAEWGSPHLVVLGTSVKGGITYGLLRGSFFGSRGDLYLGRKAGSVWEPPLLLNVTLSTDHRGTEDHTSKLRVYGFSAKQLAAGAWINLIPHYSELAHSTRNEGLTDIEESRLGISENQKPSPHLPVSIDPWPNVSRLPQSDDEKVLAAVFEARCHFDGEQGPAVYSAPEGVAPCQMPGWDGYVIASKDDEKHPLSQFWDQGPAFIAFGPFAEERRDARVRPATISYNRNHTEAKLCISIYYGGLNGTGYNAVVRKFGNEWVVIDMAMAYIS